MARHTLIYLSPIELKCYPLMIISDKCNGSWKVTDDLFMKTCVPSKTKNVTVKVLTIKRINEVKILVINI